MENPRNCKLNGGDFISSLPDDILLNILSKLTIKEQTRTGILSSRWTHLSHMWTLSSCLNIDARDFVQSEADSKIKTSKCINTIDQILRMHRGQVIDRLHIIYPVDLRAGPHDQLAVNSWIHIARQKQVKTLHLNYSSGSQLQLRSLGFSSLVTLCLEETFIADRTIHSLLSNSPNLLDLSIINCYGYLDHLNISGSSLKLNRLKLIGTFIFSLEISAPNLESFTFNNNKRDTYTWHARMCFKNIPLLTRLSCSLAFLLYNWQDFYDLLPQLVTLKLTLPKDSEFGDIGNFSVIASLKKIHLSLLSEDDNGGWLSLLLRASPCLCKLSFDLGAYITKHNIIENFPDHEFLEELEIHNFKGFEYEVQLLTCIAGSCSKLQKIIIHSDSYKRKVERESVESVEKRLTAQKDLKIVFKAPNANIF